MIGPIASLGVTIKTGVIGVMIVAIGAMIGAGIGAGNEVIDQIAAANVGIVLSTMDPAMMGLGPIRCGLRLGRRMTVVRAAMVEATGVMIAVVNAGSIHKTRARVGVAADSTG